MRNNTRGSSAARSLRMLRAAARLTQLKVALATGISANRIWRFENGVTSPKPEERERLAAFFGVADIEATPFAAASAGDGEFGAQSLPAGDAGGPVAGTRLA